MQTKKDSIKEVSTNQIVGVIVGWCIVYFLFPLFDHLDQSLIATISTGIFFISSYMRSYIIRRIFNKVNVPCGTITK